MNLFRIIKQTSFLVGMASMSFAIYIKPVSAQQRVCVITDEGVTACGKITTPAKKPVDSLQRKEVDNFVVSLQGCRRSNTTIKCKVTIKNKAQERNLRIIAFVPYVTSSTIIDSSGKSYSASNVEVGGQIGGDLSPVISPGINYVADVNFEDIPQQITQVPLLNLYVNRNIQFRNVSFLN
jgi:hypothetical protein